MWASEMLPNFSTLGLYKLTPTGAPEKRKRDDDPIYFKAFMKDSKRCLLSNLFGLVEWKFQQHKFKPNSEVYGWLQAGIEAEKEKSWTPKNFSDACAGMGHTLKANDSYIKKNGDVASGLLAQLTAIIARNPESKCALKRLRYITNKPALTQGDVKVWAEHNVQPLLTEESRISIMKDLIEEKFAALDADENFVKALKSTRNAVLHEQAGRGVPSMWEFRELCPNPKPGYVTGGDHLGRLLMEVRNELFADDLPLCDRPPRV